MTEEQRKWYLAGANDMEAGRLVTERKVEHGIGGVYDVGVDRCTRVLVSNCADVVLVGCTIDKIALCVVEEIDAKSRVPLAPGPALTAEEAKALLGEVNEGHRRNPRPESCHVCAAAAKLSLIANGENG